MFQNVHNSLYYVCNNFAIINKFANPKITGHLKIIRKYSTNNALELEFNLVSFRIAVRSTESAKPAANIPVKCNYIKVQTAFIVCM